MHNHKQVLSLAKKGTTVVLHFITSNHNKMSSKEKHISEKMGKLHFALAAFQTHFRFLSIFTFYL